MSLCFKCEIGKHTQHSDFIGRGITRYGLGEKASLKRFLKRGEICECPLCFDGTLYGHKIKS